MHFKIVRNRKGHSVYLIAGEEQLADLDLSKEELGFARAHLKACRTLVHLNRFSEQIFIQLLSEKEDRSSHLESIRRSGASFWSQVDALKVSDLCIIDKTEERAAYFFAEGLALAGYQFLKYKKNQKELRHSLSSVTFLQGSLLPKELEQLAAVVDAVALVRDFVNEPLSYLTATQFAEDLQKVGKDAPFRVTVYDEKKIRQMKMGGILAVNRGSQQPPTFTVMEHRSSKARNKKPIVLIGKGVVYDTGGLSLKPTPESMDRMKSDMSGGALVAGLLYLAGRLDLPLHLIGFVPASDNRPGQDAYVPGDVLEMADGTTVEVLNTDAEGRLLLADALHLAKKYDPELVLDFATLTGAAAVAVGDAGIVCMGTADAHVKRQLMDAGNNQYERLVEFPLWDEYRTMIESDIADLKNIGGKTAGAMTAGQFLRHFTDYPWMHFDIAGVSFRSKQADYRTAGATASGLRMAFDFLLNYSSKEKRTAKQGSD